MKRVRADGLQNFWISGLGGFSLNPKPSGGGGGEEGLTLNRKAAGSKPSGFGFGGSLESSKGLRALKVQGTARVV